MPQQKKSESNDAAEGDTRIESLSAQFQQFLARDSVRDKEMQELRQIMTFLSEQKQNIVISSRKKESPDKLIAPHSPPSSEKSVILAYAPPPFNRTLKELVSP